MKGKTVLVLLSGMYISACNDNAFSGYSNYDLKKPTTNAGKEATPPPESSGVEISGPNAKLEKKSVDLGANN